MFERIADDLITIAYERVKSGEFNEGIKYLDISLNTSEDDTQKSEIYNLMGLAYYQLGEYATAKHMFEKSINKVNIQDNVANEYIKHMGELQLVFEELCNSNVKTKIFRLKNEVLKNHPNNVSVLNYLGVLLVVKGNFKEAKRCWNKSIWLYPNNLDALNYLVQIANMKITFWKKIRTFLSN